MKAYPQRCAKCLACQMICSLIHKGVVNPLEAYIKIRWIGDVETGIEFTDECTNCGVCAEFCQYGALEVD